MLATDCFIWKILNVWITKKDFFLDIDGVLAGYLKSGKGFIDRECVKKLNRLEEFGTVFAYCSIKIQDYG